MSQSILPDELLQVSKAGEEKQHCWNLIGVLGNRSCPEIPKFVHCQNCPVYISAGSELFNREPPREWLEEQTGRLAEQDAVLDNENVTVLIFRLGNEWMAFDVQSILEVADPRVVHRVPHHTGSHLEGIVNIRGELQLCVSLARLLRLSSDTRASAENIGRQRFIVAEHGPQRWVFPVDEVSGVHHLGVRQRTEVPATLRRSARSLSKDVYDWDGKYVCRLDADRVFADLQRGFQ